jgi:diacylglycerol O-acyltransferase / wax synthase
MGGARIAEQVFWVPQSGNIGIGISILSYAGRVQIGVVADSKLVPDPQTIVDRVAAEFERLLLIALMEPWGERADPELFEANLESWLNGCRRLAAPSPRYKRSGVDFQKPRVRKFRVEPLHSVGRH